MNCPQCGSNQIKVLESRQKTENTITRRRCCLTCNARFNTIETNESSSSESAYLRLLNHYGVLSQEGMTIEECAELITALHHKTRGRAAADEVVEELADVIIMTQQLRIAYGALKVDNKIAEKLARQIARIGKERTV